MWGLEALQGELPRMWKGSLLHRQLPGVCLFCPSKVLTSEVPSMLAMHKRVQLERERNVALARQALSVHRDGQSWVGERCCQE